MVLRSRCRGDDLFVLVRVGYRLLERHRASLVPRCGPCQLPQSLSGGVRHTLVELMVHLSVEVGTRRNGTTSSGVGERLERRRTPIADRRLLLYSLATVSVTQLGCSGSWKIL